MIQIKHIILAILILFSNLFAQCDNSSVADYNNDNILDILDMVVLVDQIMNDIQDVENSDISLDGIVDVIDVIKLVLKILNPEPFPSEITYLHYSENNVFLIWESNDSPLFKEYEILMSNDVEEQIVIDVITENNITEIEISDLSLYQGTWFWVNVIDDWGCNAMSDSGLIENMEKEYELDDTGHIVSTEFSVEDFSSSETCSACHLEHVQEWMHSSHGKSMHSPLFFSMWNEEQINHPDTG